MIFLLFQNETLPRGPEPKGLKDPKLSLVTPVVFDWPGWHHSFGDVIQEPSMFAESGDVISATFVNILLLFPIFSE